MKMFFDEDEINFGTKISHLQHIPPAGIAPNAV